MRLIHHFVLHWLKYNILFVTEHVPGLSNEVMYALLLFSFL